MRREHEVRTILTAMVADATALILLYLLVTELRHTFPHWWPFDLFPGAEPVLPPVGRITITRHMYPLLLPIVPLWLGALFLFRCYDDLRHAPWFSTLLRIGLAVGGAFVTLVALLWSVQKAGLVSRTHLVAFTVTSIPTLLLVHQLLRTAIRRSQIREHDLAWVALVCFPEEAASLARALESNPDWACKVAGLILPRPSDSLPPSGYTVLGHVGQLAPILINHGIHKVFLVGRQWDITVLRDVAVICEDLGVRLAVGADFLGYRSGRARLEDYAGHPMLVFGNTPSSGIALNLKRAMDVVGAALALVLFSPILLAAAVAVKVQDGGPVFFKQVRSGLYGRPFHCYKFRTMVLDAESRKKELEALNEMQGPVFKIARDPRITRVGAFLRKTSIDEFPQFWNVLRGEMSLVGPRPPIPQEVSQYERWQVRRLSMKPGITCIWQVSGRNNVDFDTWMKLDLEYIDHWSLLLDVKLILLTIPAVLSTRGAR